MRRDLESHASHDRRGSARPKASLLGELVVLAAIGSMLIVL
jgi:hypothetical protein